MKLTAKNDIIKLQENITDAFLKGVEERYKKLTKLKDINIYGFTHIKDDYPLCYILTVVFSDGTMESINLYYCYDANDIWKRITKTLKEKYKPQEDVPAPAINPFSVPRKLNLSL